MFGFYSMGEAPSEFQFSIGDAVFLGRFDLDLRCTVGFNSLLEMPLSSRAERPRRRCVSILYWRCKDRSETCRDRVQRLQRFNSLLEMPIGQPPKCGLTCITSFNSLLEMRDSLVLRHSSQRRGFNSLLEMPSLRDAAQATATAAAGFNSLLEMRHRHYEDRRWHYEEGFNSLLEMPGCARIKLLSNDGVVVSILYWRCPRPMRP